MAAEYRIIRVGGTALNLELAVGPFVCDGWHPQGGPFRDEDTRQWCQAVTRPTSEINLKEPGRGGRR